MPELPRKAVPEGPVRELFDALHALHHQAGWPSLRDMAREVGCSHTTISVAFAGPRVPRWGLLELIVEALGGDTDEFHRRWLAASGGPPAEEPRNPSAPGDPPRDLPAGVAGFTGRTEQLAELDRLLADSRTGTAVTIAAISGTAGVGKTALAVHWAHRVADQFPDGQLYLNLRGYDPDRPVTPAEALESLLGELGVSAAAVPREVAERAARYRTLLAGKRVLVLLDNARSVDQIRDLLPGTAASFVVVTSRDSLPALVARHGGVRVGLDLLPPAEAAALLRRLIGVRVEAEPSQATALAEHCARLPLALRIAAELAAARPSVPLAGLVAELGVASRRLDLLAAGGDRYTALRAVFSWSYANLDPAAARLFRVLGAYPGRDIDLYATAAMSNVDLAAAGRALDELVRAHLIEPVGHGRYAMHDLLRAYAAELADERVSTVTALCEYHLATVTDAIRVTGRFGSAAEARAWLDDERHNLVAAAEAARRDAPEHPGLLSAALASHWDSRGYYRDALTLHGIAYAVAEAANDQPGMARALNRLGTVHRRLGRYPEALYHHRRALSLHEALGDRGGVGQARHGLGILHWRLGQYRDATEQLSRAVEEHRAVGDPAAEAGALYNLGIVARRLGRYAEAREHYDRALAIHTGIGDRKGEASVHNNLGIVELLLGRPDDALAHHRRAMDIHRELGDQTSEAIARTNVGLTLDRLGRHDEAVSHHELALATHRELGYRVGQGDALHGLGLAHLHLGRYEPAVDCLREAIAIGRELGEADIQTGALTDLGEAYLAAGRPTEAAEPLAEALGLARASGNRYEQARALCGLASLSQRSGDHTAAGEVYREALALFHDLGLPDADRLRATLTTTP